MRDPGRQIFEVLDIENLKTLGLQQLKTIVQNAIGVGRAFQYSYLPQSYAKKPLSQNGKNECACILQQCGYSGDSH